MYKYFFEKSVAYGDAHRQLIDVERTDNVDVLRPQMINARVALKQGFRRGRPRFRPVAGGLQGRRRRVTVPEHLAQRRSGSGPDWCSASSTRRRRGGSGHLARRSSSGPDSSDSSHKRRRGGMAGGGGSRGVIVRVRVLAKVLFIPRRIKRIVGQHVPVIFSKK